MLKSVTAGVLEIAFEESGPADGWPVILLHGFPYDVHTYDEVIPILAANGARVITPWLRGFGPTRFLSDDTPRSGQQAAVGHDLLALMDALEIEAACLVGYDWGGRAACIVAALWPQRVIGLVSVGSYLIQDIASAMNPASPETEWPDWYQYYFHCERGRNALIQHRAALTRLLWAQWSPSWAFSDATFAQTAASFDNPDFVDVVIHSYRHRFGLADGDPAYAETEAALAQLPPIQAPTRTLDGSDDGVTVLDTRSHARHFTGPYQYQMVEGAGHNLPQEKPRDLAEVVLALRASTDSR
jgi:pimeloyl-ACP methyl ester carboxylesterase